MYIYIYIYLQFCNGVETSERSKIKDENDTGCCSCFKIQLENCKYGLDDYVYCDRCFLAYHWKCAGYKRVPLHPERLKYICEHCRIKVLFFFIIVPWTCIS